MSKELEEKRAKMALAPANYKIVLIGIAAVIIGMVLMSGGKAPDPSVFNADELFSFRRITLAPIVVLAGFVAVGYGILKRPKNNNK